MSNIIETWLRELNAVQPQWGPLLQRTIDDVGGLPAADENDVIYTVSHDNYWFAAGYAKAYASQRADANRIRAVLAEIDAKKLADEPAMVLKEAEAKFWETIKNWVEVNGVLRMKPDPVPNWLSSLEVKWNSN